MNKTPIKRHKSIQYFSKEHHFGLLLCWKIRTGLSKSIEPGRIKEYAQWFYTNHLIPHFEMEEKYVFSLLEDNDPLIKRALSEHRKLKRLFEDTKDIVRSLSLIEEELEAHIRFEERILFNKIQQVASDKILSLVESKHSENPLVDEWEDEFWK